MAETRLCSIDNCNKPVVAKSLCGRHYQRAKKHGDPLHEKPKGKRLQFIEAVALQFSGNQCLIWPFSFAGHRYNDGGGYPQFALGRKRKINAHRYICEAVNGPAPSARHEAAHSCGNSRCVNPSHLSWKTAKENCADKIKHGTQPFSDSHPNARLSERQVLQIRQLRGQMTQSQIAKRFGLSQSYVSEIQRGAKWRHAASRARE